MQPSRWIWLSLPPTVQAKKRPKMTTNPPRGRRFAQTCLVRAEMNNPHCRRPCRTAGVTVGAKIPSGKSIWWPHHRGARRGAVEAVQCKPQDRAAAGLECAQCVPATVLEMVSEAQLLTCRDQATRVRAVPVATISACRSESPTALFQVSDILHLCARASVSAQTEEAGPH